MSKVCVYLVIIIGLVASPFTAVHSQDQKPVKKPSVSMDMDDVGSSRNNAGGAPPSTRKGATNQLEVKMIWGAKERSESYKANEGWFNAQADYQVKTKDVKVVRIEFTDKQNKTISMTFAVSKRHYGFVPGAYEQASRNMGGAPDDQDPTMNISYAGQGCNRLIGEFTVYQAEFDTSGATPKVTSFSASFSQLCSGLGLLQGTICFNAIPQDLTTKKK
jgi:hypothetical protein